MAERYLADRATTSSQKPRSLRELASDVASLSPGHSKEATADRIRKKFQKRKAEFLALAGGEGTNIELRHAGGTERHRENPCEFRRELLLPNARFGWRRRLQVSQTQRRICE